MSDRGIGALIPGYEKSLLVAADTAYWEALYDDGTVLSEADGGLYPAIERGRLSSFRLIHGGETLVEAFVPVGATGYNLVYRRRTALGQSGAGRSVLFIFGYVPMGPVFVVDLDAGTCVVHKEDTIAQLDLTPMRGEPDGLLTSG